MSSAQLPLLAITAGDPAGIGTEVLVAAWQDRALRSECIPIAIARPEVLERACHLRGLALRFESYPADQVDQACMAARRADWTTLVCVAAGDPAAGDVVWGRDQAAGGQAAFDCLRLSTTAALAGKIDGLVTCPLSKAALWMAGHQYPGHTELLAEWCGVQQFCMMLYLPPGPPLVGAAGLGVAHVTLHLGLKQIWEELSTARIVERGHLLREMLRKLHPGHEPRLGVAALNPHAGESGLFGDEETRLIAPAVQQLQKAGVNVQGPLPADTLLVRAKGGEFDGVVAMYHDQGHIALKLLGMDRAVNVTLGLPIVRTSVAHGTAYDIAGRGIARHLSLLEAARVAARLSKARCNSAV